MHQGQTSWQDMAQGRIYLLQYQQNIFILLYNIQDLMVNKEDTEQNVSRVNQQFLNTIDLAYWVSLTFPNIKFILRMSHDTRISFFVK